MEQHTKENFEVIMVDNGSTDSSIEYVRTHFPRVEVVALDKNYGFAEGNNIGVKHAKGQYLIFVSMDTKAEKEWLQNLIDAADNHKEYQILCSILFPRPQKGIPTLGVLGNVILSPSESDRAITDSLLAGAQCFLIRKEWLNKIGYLFDPHYFCHLEDVELSLRTILTGGRIGHVRDSRIYHYWRGSGYDQTWALRLLMRNGLLTYYKLFSLQNFVKILITRSTLPILGRSYAAKIGWTKGLVEFFCYFRLYKDYRKRFEKIRMRDDKYVLQRFIAKSRVEKILKKALWGC